MSSVSLPAVEFLWVKLLVSFFFVFFCNLLILYLLFLRISFFQIATVLLFLLWMLHKMNWFIDLTDLPLYDKIIIPSFSCHVFQIIKMMVTVVVIYAICWLPLHIINIAGDLNPGMYDLPHMNIVWALFHWLAMSNSMYNPIIYCWMNSKFRMGFKRVFSRMLCGLVKVRDESDNTRNFSRQETVVTSVHSTSVRRICFSGSRVKFTQEDIPLQPAKTKAWIFIIIFIAS